MRSSAAICHFSSFRERKKTTTTNRSIHIAKHKYWKKFSRDAVVAAAIQKLRDVTPKKWTNWNYKEIVSNIFDVVISFWRVSYVLALLLNAQQDNINNFSVFLFVSSIYYSFDMLMVLILSLYCVFDNRQKMCVNRRSNCVTSIKDTVQVFMFKFKYPFAVCSSSFIEMLNCL